MATEDTISLLKLLLLGPLAYLIDLASVPLSPLFPFPLATTLHAARVGLAYKGRTKALGHDGAMKAKGRGVEWAGYLVMCWGGSFITSFLQQTPPPQLLSPLPWIQYLSVYTLISNPAFTALLPSPAILDTLLPIIDGLTRSFPISGAVLSTSTHPNPSIRGSLMFQLLCGGLAASGGGIAATTLNVFSPEWRISTPPILFTGLLGCLDFLAGSAAAGIFGFLTASHPAYLPFIDTAKSLVMTPSPAKPAATAAAALMTVLGARSVVVLFLSIVYATRAFMLHWYSTLIAPPRPVAAGAVSGEKVGSARDATRIVVQDKEEGKKRV
ncbi:hypothetical protein QFC22_000087 [Naganishia vaughanmartiniae]|uniref:Uncharacterized protein n=1 Tax=Naganishia vaughanmartiniae TaxID=1424756 RepID=A0ACC2XNC7_9TREE|nr:hypothetical protein QFC22_000087 [Naganishia vaughanmartiniae]